jgi:hypothetical protein
MACIVINRSETSPSAPDQFLVNTSGALSYTNARGSATAYSDAPAAYADGLRAMASSTLANQALFLVHDSAAQADYPICPLGTDPR